MGASNVNPSDNGFATSTAAAATNHHTATGITTEALTTVAGADYTFTLTDNVIAANSLVFVSVTNGTNTTLYPVVHSIQPAAGSVVFKVRNAHATVALNGTLVLNVIVF